MKTVLVYGQNHKGSTYHVAHGLAEKLGGEIREFFLPRDFDEFCTGCQTCFADTEKKCPHYGRLAPITEALDAADVIILASPVYVYHVSGAMKAFLDHYGYRWMVHSPEGSMFTKQGVCVCTAAGAGMKSTIRDMADSLYFWGVAKTYRLGMGVAAVNWAGVSEKKKAEIDKKTSAIAAKITSRVGKVKPGIKTKAAFMAMRQLQGKHGFNPRDVEHWKQQGWTEDKRPWKDKA